MYVVLNNPFTAGRLQLVQCLIQFLGIVLIVKETIKRILNQFGMVLLHFAIFIAESIAVLCVALLVFSFITMELHEDLGVFFCEKQERFMPNSKKFVMS